MTVAHRLVRRGLLALAAVALLPAPLWSQGPAPSDEYRLKAAFVYRFPQFVEWPSSALDGRGEVSICVLRPSPFGRLLRDLTAGETLNGRPLAVREIDRASAAHGCHAVFVSRRHDAVAKAVLRAVADRPVLTIGESPRFLDDGGVIAMQVLERRVRFEVSAPAAERVGLKLSSQLLKLAVRVRGAA